MHYELINDKSSYFQEEKKFANLEFLNIIDQELTSDEGCIAIMIEKFWENYYVRSIANAIAKIPVINPYSYFKMFWDAV